MPDNNDNAQKVTSIMKNTSLLLWLGSLALCLQDCRAFHERVARGNSFAERKPIIQQGDGRHASVALARHRSQTTTTTTTTTTALYASRQFRNVEEMLDSFQEELVLINFMAVNCGPCKLQKKELAAVSQTVGQDACKVLAIDTNRWPSVSSRFEVGKLPCLVAMKNGDVVFRLEGYTKAEDVVARVRSVQQQQQQQKQPYRV